MTDKLHKKVTFFGVAVCTAVLAVTVNLLFGFAGKFFRWDATPGHLYSLSYETLNFLADNKMPVAVQFYQTAKLENKNPKLGEYADYVRKILQQYKSKGDGKIDISWIEVEPFQNTQVAAEKAGIKEFDYTNGNRYLYLGANFTTADGFSRTIPQFLPENKNSLEDDITRNLSVLTSRKNIKIGIISPFFDVIEDKDVFMRKTVDAPFISELRRQGFQLEPLSADIVSIPKDFDAVLVFYPSKYDIAGIYALDQYLVHGGRVMMFLDSFFEDRFRGEDVFVPYESGLLPLLDKYGVFYHENQLVGNNIHNRELFMDGQSVKYPFWLELVDDNLKDHKILNGIHRLRFNHSGFFETALTEGLVTTVLAATDQKSGIMPAEKIVNLGYDYLSANYLVTDGEYPVVVLLEGQFTSLFEGPFTDDVKVMADFLPFSAVADKEGKLLLIGDADMVSAALWQKDAKVKEAQHGYDSDNLLFLRNALDYLTESGYAEVGKKSVAEEVGITDVVSQKILAKYQGQRNKIFQAREDVKKGIEEQVLQMEKEQVPSILQIKQLENLKRQEIEVNKNIDKVSYMIAEEYNNLTSWFFLITIFLFPLLFGLIVGGGYFIYQKKMYRRFEEKVK